jgi:hypothetical protein
MPLSDTDFHEHLRARMAQRGISREELERTLEERWPALDAKPRTIGTVFVFSFNQHWEGRWYAEKEVSV